MTLLLIGLVIFFASHLLPTRTGLKEKLIASIGQGPYRGLVSLVAIIALVLIIWGYGQARENPISVWEPPDFMRHIVFLAMIPVFPLLIQSLLPGTMKKVVPHPLLMATKIWAFSHLLANGDAASIILFGSFLIYAIVDLISAKKRERAGLVDVKIGSVSNDYISIVLGLALYALFLFWAHDYLIGVGLVAL